MKRRSSFFAAGVLILCMSTPALSDDFPGKGSRSGWSEALPHYNVANKYLARGLYEQAANHYQQAINFYGQDPDFFVNYGVALRKLENYNGAEQAFKRALELRENDWETWSNLANAYLKQNRLSDTIICFQQAMKYAPPAQEKEAMLKDIADIKKILSMQAPPPVASAKPGLTKGVAATSKTSLSAAAAASKNAAPLKGLAPANSAQTTPAAPPDKQQLKNSGWDWVY